MALDYIIEQLISIQADKLWLGTSFNDKLNEINDKNAFLRPIPDLHSVAEIVSHLTVWQNETVLKIEKGFGELTDDDEKNWSSNIELRKKSWNTIYDDYRKSLERLISILKTKDDSFLHKDYYDADFKGKYPYSFIINGMLHHSLYHLGQLGIIIKYLNPTNELKIML